MVTEQLGNAFGFDETEILKVGWPHTHTYTHSHAHTPTHSPYHTALIQVSAKLGTGVDGLLPNIIERVPRYFKSPVPPNQSLASLSLSCVYPSQSFWRSGREFEDASLWQLVWPLQRSHLPCGCQRWLCQSRSVKGTSVYRNITDSFVKSNIKND